MKTQLVNKIAVTALTLASAIAMADGPSSSGGGAALVCRSSEGKIEYSELLDLYEARVVMHRPLVQPTGSVTRDYFLAAANTYRLQGAPGLADREKAAIEENLRRFFDIAQMTAPGVKLPTLGDLGEAPQAPEGCAIEQLAIFHDEIPNRVEIDSEIWNSLNSVNRSALVTHEAYYAWERTLRERTSQNTRVAVGIIYAASGVEPVKSGVPQDALTCFSEDPRFLRQHGRSSGSDRLSSFSVYPVMTPEGKGTRLQFGQIGGRPILTKTTVEIPGVEFALGKIEWDQTLNIPVSKVSEANKNVHLEIPLRGGVRENASVEVSYVTGQPVRLSFKVNGVTETEEILTTCY